MEVKDNMKSVEVINIKQFLKEIENIDLNPYFQRGSVWDNNQKQNYLKSFLEDYTVDTIVIGRSDKNCSNNFANCDGKQRSLTLQEFFNNVIGISDGCYTYYYSKKPQNKIQTKVIDKETRSKLMHKQIILVRFKEKNMDLQKLFRSINTREENVISEKDLHKEFLEENKKFVDKMNEKFKLKFKKANHERSILKLFYNSNLEEGKENLFIKEKLLGEIEKWYMDGTLKKKQEVFESKIDSVLDRIKKKKLDIFVLGIMIMLMRGHRIKNTTELYEKMSNSSKVDLTVNTRNFVGIIDYLVTKVKSVTN